MSNDQRDVMYSTHPPATLSPIAITTCAMLGLITVWPLGFLIYAIITTWL
jgi:hypothetical protein